ncbi:MAG: nicotinate-nucleotide--dimethylbenzimidazole phosphoribosyltransferase [Alphaproteobacteria bacterium]|nr:nicotinate-nucleotide--dimethylbenzimidazole phosphoribosyltransferase [Alphaproteobacteria bacterium]
MDAAAKSGLPFDDIRNLVKQMPEADQTAMDAARDRQGQLTKPPGSLGQLEEIAIWMAGWQGDAVPQVKRPLCAVFAGNHGVVAQGVSAFPAEVTAQMVANFSAGGAAVNQLCSAFDVGLKVFELALEMPTEDITQGPALSEAECAATMAYGMEAIAGGCDLLCIGEMGIGNTTIAAAIAFGLYGGAAEDWVGPGTGVDAEGLKRKAEVLRAAIGLNEGQLGDPLEVLRRLGGREIAAMAGAILAARMERVPVLIDGFVATSAAAVLHAMDPGTLDHCWAAHKSAEPAHVRMLEKIGKAPLLDLGMRLGEGSGAALAVAIIKGALATHGGMATFAEAGVSDKD